MRSLNLIVEQREGEYYVSSDPDKIDMEFIYNWLSGESYWNKNIPFELFKRYIDHSFCFGVYHDQVGQVGFGRTITDFTTFAWVSDVFITKEHRGKGLSVLLMKTMMEHPEMRIIRRWMLGTDHAHGLYRKLGFTDLDHPENFLTIHCKNMYQDGQYAERINSFIKDM
jgi:GNAT superfamily N-acetyltransferase